MSEYVSVAEYAAVAGETPAQIRRYLRAGTLEGQKTGSRWEVGEAAYLTAKKAHDAVLTGTDRPKKQRLGMGAIRGLWEVIFAIGGQGLGFVIDAFIQNYAGLPIALQPWSGFLLGGVGYGIKKYRWPDTQY